MYCGTILFLGTFFIFYDGAQPSKIGSAPIKVSRSDVNDKRPQFLHSSYFFYVEENGPRGLLVGEVSACDTDNQCTFALHDPYDHAEKAFDIDQHTGQIITVRSLDREAQSLYYFNVVATDSNDSNLVSTTTVTIYVGDVNDNAPVFIFPNPNAYTIHISPRFAFVNHIIGIIKAEDLDQNNNGRVTYTIDADAHDGWFSLDPFTGCLTLDVDIRSVGSEPVILVVRAQDHGVPPRTAVSIVRVVVIPDDTSNAP